MAQIGINISLAVNILQQGNLVGIPTETVYGLAANALDSKAVTKIFTTKERPSFDPLIVHTDSLQKVDGLVKDIPPKAQLLANGFWPGPLTLLLQKKEIIPDLVTSGLNTVAVRIPRHPLTKSLLERLDFPLAAPSANPFGYISPTTAKHVDNQLGDKIEYILDGGACMVGVESTIIGFDQDTPIVHRLGGTTIKDIEQVVGKVKLMPHSSSNPSAPGMLASHYAPKKKLVLGDLSDLRNKYAEKTVALLSFKKVVDRKNVYFLSENGDLNEAAQNLFGRLRELDGLPVDVILAELVPDEGLGKAINDRLKRAASK